METKEAELGSENIKNKNENEANIELLAEKMISEMKKGLVGLGDAKNTLDKYGDGVALEDKGAEDEIRNDPAIVGRLDNIASRAKEALNVSKRAAKKAVAIAMATMAFSGTAGKFNDNIEEPLKNINLISSAEASESEEEKAPTYGEKAKQKMIDRIKSATYLERLAKEVDGNIEEAKKIQQERLENIESSQIIYFDDLESLRKAYAEMGGDNHNGSTTNNAFSFKSINNETGEESLGIALPKKKIGHSSNHEMSHPADDFGENIPKKTIEKLDKMEIYDINVPEVAAYLKKPTEILARKHAIDDKMEDLGIKKYEEKFTLDHFVKLLEIERAEIGVKSEEDLQKYIESGKVIPEGIELMIIFGQEHLEELFNEIADNENGVNSNKDVS